MTNITPNDIEIEEMQVYCDECKEDLTVVSGYYCNNLMYSMDVHDDTAEDMQEIYEMVKDISVQYANEELEN